MLSQVEVNVVDESQVGEVRRLAMRLARDTGFSEVRQAEAGIIATEIATNLVRHARRGRVLLQQLTCLDAATLEMVSLDAGPGMPDVDRCLRDGFSTIGTAGTGLGAIRRLSHEFALHSEPQRGTVLVSRLRENRQPAGPGSAMEFGVVSTPAPGEVVCGDTWSVCLTDDSFAAMIADGLGHGVAAFEAASRAADSFDQDCRRSPLDQVSQAHRALQGTRGAAMAAVRTDCRSGQLQYAGVGNIASVLVQPAEQRGLMSYNGIVGSLLPKVQQMLYPCEGRALLIMHSDGLQTRWRLEDYPGLGFQHAAIIAAVLYRDYLRGRDDATVMVVKFEAGRI